jgi:molybdenum cofactor cytidylyltransferase
MKRTYGILVLAAGQSSRFGSDKLLAKMSDGKHVIAHTLAPLQKIAAKHRLPIMVITRPDNHRLIDYFDTHHIEYSVCLDAHLGMGNSIADGVKSNQDWYGWIIALADMPNLSTDILEILIDKINSHPDEIIRLNIFKEDRNTPSHPVYFPKEYGFKLSQLSGDNGARKLITKQHLINVSDELLLLDIDTPEALTKANESI